MKLGLIGKTLSHSFSKSYFENKFKNENLENHSYDLFELNIVEDFTDLIKNNPDLVGLNVTVPYKESILPFLDELDNTAKEIGAVNTIMISSVDGKKYLKVTIQMQ